MKKSILIFIAGMITTLLLEVFIGIISATNNIPGLTLFEKEGSSINAKQIEIFQTIAPNVALAYAKTNPYAIYDNNQLFVLILGNENTNYYDDQKINVPRGKSVKQIGTYQYKTAQGIYKTVPAVEIK